MMRMNAKICDLGHIAFAGCRAVNFAPWPVGLTSRIVYRKDTIIATVASPIAAGRDRSFGDGRADERAKTGPVGGGDPASRRPSARRPDRCEQRPQQFFGFQ